MQQVKKLTAFDKTAQVYTEGHHCICSVSFSDEDSLLGEYLKIQLKLNLIDISSQYDIVEGLGISFAEEASIQPELKLFAYGQEMGPSTRIVQLEGTALLKLGFSKLCKEA